MCTAANSFGAPVSDAIEAIRHYTEEERRAKLQAADAAARDAVIAGAYAQIAAATEVEAETARAAEAAVAEQADAVALQLEAEMRAHTMPAWREADAKQSTAIPEGEVPYAKVAECVTSIRRWSCLW